MISGPPVNVVQSVDELPQSIQRLARQGAAPQGVAHQGQVFLIADNLRTAEDARKTLAHEAVGHVSMEQMLGEQFEAVMERVQRLKESGNRRVNDVAADVRRRYGEDIDPLTESREIVATMAEQGVRAPFMKEIVAAVRRFLRRMGLGIKWSRSELEALIAKAERRLQRDAAVGASRDDRPAAFSRADSTEGETNPEPESGRPGSRIVRIAGSAFEPVGGFLKRNFTSAGDVPESVFDRKIQEDGWVRSHQKAGENLIRDFRRAAREAYGGKTAPNMTEEQTRELDAALKGEIPLEQVPQPLRQPITQMRTHIDILSQKMVREGVVKGDMAAKVTDNLGVYATRSYRVFDDPKWAKQVPEDVRNKAKALLRQEYRGMIAEEWAQRAGVSQEEALQAIQAPGTEANQYREDRLEGVIAHLLYEGKAADSPIALISQSKLGSKDLSILKKRKDIAPEIRALWGEHRDPMVNYVKSVEKMSHLISNHKLLRDMRQLGLGQFFFTEPIVRDGQEYKTRVATEESETLWPLNVDERGEASAIYTTPEIKQALEEAVDPVRTGPILSSYMKLIAATKFAKTVASPMTHMRNLIGNTGFAMANGHWRVGKSGGAWKNTLADLSHRGDAEMREYISKMLRLGVLHESVRAGEMRDILEDASSMSMDAYVGNVFTRATKRTTNAMTRLYQAEDDVWKVYAFENEKARYRKAMPDATESEVESRAAKIVRMTYPTYSAVPRGVKFLRRSPLVGTFVSFPAEIIRTVGNTVSLIRDELADPRTRGIGAQRAAGALAAAYVTEAVARTSMYMLGMSDEDDEDFRQFVPRWSKNSDIIYLGQDAKGNTQWVDASYTDPYAYLKTPLHALINGEDWQSKVLEAGQAATDPFLSEEILTGHLVDIVRNRTQTGGQVYNPQGSWDGIATDVGGHIREAFKPGAANSAERIYKGLTGTVETYGKSYDPTVEALAVLTGVRRNTMNVAQALTFRASEYARGRRDAARLFTYTASSRGQVDEGELREAYRDGERLARAIREPEQGV